MGSGGLLCEGLKKLLDWENFPTLSMMASHLCCQRNGEHTHMQLSVLVRETFFRLPF